MSYSSFSLGSIAKGDSGFSGYSGYSGISGYSGYSGAAGTIIAGTGSDDRIVRWDGTSDIQNSLVTINDLGSILPTTDDAQDLGSDSLRWRDLYLGPGSLNLGTSGNESIFSFDTVSSLLNINSPTEINLSINSNPTIEIDDEQIRCPTGNATKPGISFTDSPDYGLSVSATVLNIITDGVAQLTCTSTLNSSIQQFQVIDGLVTNPSIRFTSSNTGFYYTTGAGFYIDNFNISISGTNTFTFHNSGISVINGIEARPSISFLTDLTSGIYLSNTNEISISTNAVQRFVINSTGNILPGANNTQDLGSDTLRWKDIYLGPNTVHVGTSITDEGQINYNTTTNTLTLGTNTASTMISISGSNVDIDSLTINSSSAIVVDIRTNVRASGSATDTALVTEKAVRDAVDAGGGGGGVTGSGIDDRIARWNGTGAIEETDFTISGTAGSQILQLPIGSAAAPTLTFSGDTNTGVFGPVSDSLGITTAGAERFRITGITNGAIISNVLTEIIRFDTAKVDLSVPLWVDNGSDAAPTIAFNSNTNTGIFRPVINVIGITTAGAERFRIAGITNGAIISNVSTEIFRFDTTKVDLSVPLWVDNGSDAAPTIAFNSNTNTGVFRPTANVIGITISGAERFRIAGITNGAIISNVSTEIFRFNTTSIDFALLTTFPSFRVDNGSAAAPSIAFVSSNTTGFFRAAANVIGITTSGVERFRIAGITNGAIISNVSTEIFRFTTSNIDFSVPVQVDVGSESAPNYTFNGDTNTGVFRPAIDSIGFTTNSAERVRIDNVGNLFTYTGMLNMSITGIFALSSADVSKLYVVDLNGAGTAGFKMATETGIYTVVGTDDSISASTGILTIRTGNGNSADSDGLISLTTETGSVVYVPYIIDPTP